MHGAVSSFVVGSSISVVAVVVRFDWTSRGLLSIEDLDWKPSPTGSADD